MEYFFYCRAKPDSEALWALLNEAHWLFMDRYADATSARGLALTPRHAAEDRACADTHRPFEPRWLSDRRMKEPELTEAWPGAVTPAARRRPCLRRDRGEAAACLRCSKQRIDDLLSARRLSQLRNGARVLLRAELDDHMSRGVARVSRDRHEIDLGT
jgi:hypothetical protein